MFILLAVGALIGAWNMAGHDPDRRLLRRRPAERRRGSIAATAIVCGLVGLAIGSSWTTAATLGVAFVALAPLLGADPVIAAGAVISGAYFGDKMTPISETTVLVPVDGRRRDDPGAHRRHALDLRAGDRPVDPRVRHHRPDRAGVRRRRSTRATRRRILAGEFNISLINLLPMVLLVILSHPPAPPFLAIFGSAIFAAVLAVFTQPEAVAAFVGETGRGRSRRRSMAIYSALATGFVSNSGNETIDSLFSRGGMASMLITIWLVLGALSFAAIMEDAGFLERLIRPVLAAAQHHRPADRGRGRDVHRAEHHRR